ncbi:hypothetical protein WPAUFG111_04150 [Wolbachia pipientis]
MFAFINVRALLRSFLILSFEGFIINFLLYLRALQPRKSNPVVIDVIFVFSSERIRPPYASS